VYHISSVNQEQFLCGKSSSQVVGSDLLGTALSCYTAFPESQAWPTSFLQPMSDPVTNWSYFKFQCPESDHDLPRQTAFLSCLGVFSLCMFLCFQQMILSIGSRIIYIYFFLLLFWVLGFELRILFLQGKCSTSWLTPPTSPFCF
jgi:hypothetical protein